jgi:uncharacterized protein YggT (Ycf19 family)
MSDYREVRTVQHEQGQEQRAATFKATQIIWLLLGLLEGVLALRVFFKVIAVNAENPFASLLYSVTGPFVAPFASLVGSPSAAGMVLEFSSIIAMVVYLLIAWVIERMVYVFFYRPRGPVSTHQTIVGGHVPEQSTETVVTQRTNDQTSGTLRP